MPAAGGLAFPIALVKFHAFLEANHMPWGDSKLNTPRGKQCSRRAIDAHPLLYSFGIGRVPSSNSQLHPASPGITTAVFIRSSKTFHLFDTSISSASSLPIDNCALRWGRRRNGPICTALNESRRSSPFLRHRNGIKNMFLQLERWTRRCDDMKVSEQTPIRAE